MYNSPVYLDHETHTYIHKETKEVYPSVTTILSKIKEPFDGKRIASNIVKQSDDRKNPKYKGLNQQQILDLWKQGGKEAADYGTKIHGYLEDYLLGNPIESQEAQGVIESFKLINPIKSNSVYPERIVYSSEYKLAGTADVVEDDYKMINVWDFKTNKGIDYVNNYGKWLKPPVSYLSDCGYNVYSLQLSIYAFMLQLETGKKIGRLGIIWYDKGINKFSIIPVAYMLREAKAVLDHIQI